MECAHTTGTKYVFFTSGSLERVLVCTGGNRQLFPALVVTLRGSKDMIEQDEGGGGRGGKVDKEREVGERERGSEEEV